MHDAHTTACRSTLKLDKSKRALSRFIIQAHPFQCAICLIAKANIKSFNEPYSVSNRAIIGMKTFTENNLKHRMNLLNVRPLMVD